MSIKISFGKALSSERVDRFRQLQNDFSIDTGVGLHNAEMELLVEETELSLRCISEDPKAWIKVSFDQGVAHHRRLYGGGVSQLISKALGLEKNSRLKILDTTAGLAGDSFVMASLGADVSMLERSPILAAMIQDSMDIAANRNPDDEKLLEILGRLHLVYTDAIFWLREQPADLFDVIYLDPMFPERKKKASVKKEMQILQALLSGNDGNETELLKLAIEKARFRVVVKRPRHAPALEGSSCGYSLEGKSTRFDIYPKKAISS